MPTATTKTAKPAEQAVAPVEAEPLAPVVEPSVILGGKKKKKKKKRYTRSIRGVQRLEVGASKSQRRVAKAVVRGLNAWIDATDKSARKKRDGAVKDGLKNTSKAMRKALRTAAEAPADFIDQVAKIKRPF